MAANRSDSPQPAIVRAKREKFRPAVKIAAALLYIVVFLVLAEVALRLLTHFGAEQLAAGPGAVRAPLYSVEELRHDLPRYSERQSGDCVIIRTGFHWDPRFGFASKKLNKACARNLFAAHKTSVVLMGGSAMEDAQAQNYLTSIDTYAFGDDPSVASLNLAESGARHSNMQFRFLHEVLELHPTYAVFLDGFNEFNSVRYGGAPDDDFYWTAGVKDRVEHPLLFFRDKLVGSSRLLELLALKTGFINSARIVRTHVDPQLVTQAAEYYVNTRAHTETICKAYGIKCIFIIQPTALLDKTPSESAKWAVQQDLRSFRSDADVFRTGYDYILSKAGDKVLDATHLFDGKGDVYIDVVHFNKLGSKLMGDYIRDTLH
jgi:hypothetical protein